MAGRRREKCWSRPERQRGFLMIAGGGRTGPAPGGGGGGGGSSIKPSRPTPSLPTAVRNRYLTAGAAPGGDGLSPATAWNDPIVADNSTIAGDHIHVNGDFDIVGGNPIGQGGAGGTLANPRVWKKASGASSASFKLGGGANAFPCMMIFGDYNWFHDVSVANQTGADGDNCIRIYGDHNIFTSGGCTKGGIRLIGANFNYFYDYTQTGDTGSPAVGVNAGEAFLWESGSSNNGCIRFRMLGRAGHSAWVVHDPTPGAVTCFDNELFDFEIHNRWAGGLQLLGGGQRTTARWGKIIDVGRDFEPGAGSKESIQNSGDDNVYEHIYINGGASHGLSLQCSLVGGVINTSRRGKFRNITIVGCYSMPIHMGSAQAGVPSIDPKTMLVDNEFVNIVAWNNWLLPGITADQGFIGGVYYLCVNYQGGAANTWASNNAYGNVFKNIICGHPTLGPIGFYNLQRLPIDGGSLIYTPAEWIALSPSSQNIQLGVDPNLNAADFYRPNTGSPCIDAGVATGASAPYDSYLGAAPDIGWLEHGSSDS